MSNKLPPRVTHLWDDEWCVKCYQCGYNNIIKLKNAGEVKFPEPHEESG